MNGIFGWAGAPGGRDSALSQLQAMGHAGHQHTRAGSSFELAGSCGIGINERPLPASLATEGSRLAAIQGRIHWPEVQLDQLARERGAAAALLVAHARWGDELPVRLGGSFALAVLDSASNHALLAVDRLGMRTMCYAVRSPTLLFGTTADQVAAHVLAEPRIALQSVYEYLYAHVVPSPDTIYVGIEKLLPAERIIWSDGRMSRDFYWRMSYTAVRTGQAVAQAAEFKTLLDDATRSAIGDAPLPSIGAFLSGGTDSSTIAGVLRQVTGEPADTYSIGFDAEGFDEIEYARIAARRFGLSSHEYYVTPEDVAQSIPQIAAVYDEPFGNASAVPTLLCARRAAQDGKTVLLAGDGGDELFGGNARYAKQKIFEWYWRLPLPVRRDLIERIAGAMPATGGPALLRKLRSYVDQARVPLPQRLETYNLIERETPAAVFTEEFLSAVDIDRPLRLAAEAFSRAATSAPVDQMMHLDLKITLADSDLRKVTRMCELAGIEARFPLLDERLVAFSGRLTPEQKVRGTQLRHFFKWALRDFLPREILRKSKHGFGLPFGPWMRSNRVLEEMALGSLEALHGRGWITRPFVDSLLAAHRTGNAAYYGTTIWVAMMLEQWLRARRLN